MPSTDAGAFHTAASGGERLPRHASPKPLVTEAPVAVACAPPLVACDGTCVDVSGSDRHCGGCGDTCWGEIPCVEGKCPIRLPIRANGLAVDATHVYFTTGADQDGAVLRTPKRGGAISTIASGQANPSGLEVDGESVVWSNLGVSSSKDGLPHYSGGGIMKAPLAGVPAGGAATTLVAVDSLEPAAVTRDGTSVYWLNRGTELNHDMRPDARRTSSSPRGALVKVALGGGAALTLAADQRILPQRVPSNIAVDATRVYFTAWTPDFKATQILTVPLEGGRVTTLVGKQGGAPLAVDGERLYWITCGTPPTFRDSGVFSVPIAGGPVTALLTEKCGDGLAVDARNVYAALHDPEGSAWRERDVDEQIVVKIPKAGGAAKTLASATANNPHFFVPGALVLDGSSLYVLLTYGANSTSNVLRLSTE